MPLPFSAFQSLAAKKTILFKGIQIQLKPVYLMQLHQPKFELQTTVLKIGKSSNSYFNLLKTQLIITENSQPIRIANIVTKPLLGRLFFHHISYTSLTAYGIINIISWFYYWYFLYESGAGRSQSINLP